MIVRGIAFAIALCFANAAQAQVVWSTPASACTPSEATIHQNRYVTSGPTVKHAANNVDPIELNCFIPRFNSGTTNWNLRLTYVDSTGTAATGLVRVALLKMPLGTITPQQIGFASSNASAATALNTVQSATFMHTFDFETNIYWARIDIDRTAANQIVVAHAVSLGLPLVSDIRAKHDIALLGRLDNGLGFYRFSYNGSDQAYVGVMAQEVEAIMPHAVVRGEDGYLRVYYDQLGFDMQTFEQWRAAGGKLPQPNL